MLDSLKRHWSSVELLLVRGDDSLLFTNDWDDTKTYIERCALKENMIVKVRRDTKVGKFCCNIIHQLGETPE